MLDQDNDVKLVHSTRAKLDKVTYQRAAHKNDNEVSFDTLEFIFITKDGEKHTCTIPVSSVKRLLNFPALGDISPERVELDNTTIENKIIELDSKLCWLLKHLQLGYLYKVSK